MKLQTGDIIFVDSGTFFGNLVKWGTKFEYGHVAIAVDEYHVIDIRAMKKSSIIHIDELKHNVYEVHRCKVPFNKDKIKLLIEASTNIPYDYSAVFKLFLKMRLGISYDKPYTLNKTYCSEFIDYVFSQMDINLIGLDNSLVSIEDVYESELTEVVEYG